ncbi:MAG TPA: hypothetical protein VGD81_03390 [Opitutaceae bacterium]
MKSQTDDLLAVTEAPSRDTRLRLAVGLLSAAITAHQLALMQVLAYVHWHHFAYMVVAVALLGFGAAGTVLTFLRHRLLAHATAVLPWFMLACGLAMPAGVWLSQAAIFSFDLYLLFLAPRPWFTLAAVYLLLLPPFFLGGLATSLVLTAHARRAGRFYFASLAGAGAGGVAGFLILDWIEPPRLPAAVSLLAVAAGACLWRDVAPRWRWLAALFVILNLGAPFRAGDLRPSQFKPVSRALDLPEARVIAHRPAAPGWVQVVAAPALRPAPPLSLNFAGDIPIQPAVFINGYAHGALLPAAGKTAPAWLDFTTEAAALAGTSPRRVLLLEAGPDGAAAQALAAGARRVVVIEPHHVLARMLTATANAGNGPLAPEWTLPGVEVVAGSGRRFLRDAREEFDLIRLPGTGSAAGSGLTSTTEQFLLTREAVSDAWRRLAPGGALAVTCPMDFPVRHALRAAATLVEALADAGVRSPAGHLVAVRGWTTVSFVAYREPVDEKRATAVRACCAERSFDPLLLPGARSDEERNTYNHWPDPGFFADMDRVVTGDRQAFYRTYPFRVEPATDERPYFSQFLRWTSLRELKAAFGQRTLPFFELGTLMVALTFLQLLGLAIMCILLPLGRLGGPERRRVRLRETVLYFAGLGAGYMLVEVGLMLRVHAWLGQPLLAAGVVLAGLLFFSGLGSLCSDRWRPGRRIRMAVTLACMLAIGLTAASTAWLAPRTDGWNLPAQVAAAFALMAPVGFVLGLAFPLGLRHLEARAPAHVPWAWAINGCISVATPAAAMLVAIEAGRAAVFGLATAAYALAWFGAWSGAAADDRDESRG